LISTPDTAEQTRDTNSAFVRILIQIQQAYGVPTETCERLLELYLLSNSLIVRRAEEIVTASAGGKL
jgi:hypothetical protein